MIDSSENRDVFIETGGLYGPWPSPKKHNVFCIKSNNKKLIYNDIPVITNDLFRDHIFDMFKMFDSKNNQIKHYIESMCLQYGKKIESFVNFSHCIQYDEDNIYIPTKDHLS